MVVGEHKQFNLISEFFHYIYTSTSIVQPIQFPTLYYHENYSYIINSTDFMLKYGFLLIDFYYN